MQSRTVFILSGPAGVGKTTIWHEICDKIPHIGKIITTTSRNMREGEKNGIDYHFISKSDFENRIKNEEMIEYAVVHTNYYGSTFAELDRIIAEKKNPLYIIEPQGMVHIKPILEKKWYRVCTIFLLPPSIEELKNRLSKRGTESKQQYEIRIATALHELEQQDFYDIKIVNDELERAKQELISIFSHDSL